MPVTEHVHDKTGTRYLVDSDAKTVQVKLPNGKLRYAGAVTESILALPQYKEPNITSKTVTPTGEVLHIDDKEKAVYTQTPDGKYKPIPLVAPAAPEPQPQFTYEQAKALPPAPVLTPAAAPKEDEKDDSKAIIPPVDKSAPTTPASKAASAPTALSDKDDKSDTSKK